MKLIINIHDTVNKPNVASFVARTLKQNPDAYYLYFPWIDITGKEMEKVSQKFPRAQERSFLIAPKEKMQHRFEPYNASLTNALAILAEKRKRGELVEVVLFGGSASVCYRNICPNVVEQLYKTFGRTNVIARSHLPLIYGRHGPKGEFLHTPAELGAIKKKQNQTRRKR